MKAEYDVEVEWRAFYLRPDTPPEGMRPSPEMRAQAGSVTGRLRQRAQAGGREMVMPDVIPNTRRAHEATEYAREQGQHEAFHAAVFTLYYGEGRDISRWEVLREAARRAGLDPDEMQARVETGAYRERVEEQIREAYAAGITGVPTYILGDRYAIVGAQPYEVFVQTLAKLAAE